MKRDRNLKVVLLGAFIFLTVLVPLKFQTGGHLVPAKADAFAAFTSLSTSPGTCTTYNPLPITDGKLPAASSLGGLVIPGGATYACAYPNGGGYQYFDAQGKYLGDTTGGLGQDTTNRDQNNNAKIAPADCSSVLTAMTSPFTCMFRSLVSLTAATLIYIASWILTLSGVLFNWLVTNTITQFGNLYTSTVQTAVNAAWTAFRDIANILIIGIFTFIAISIILGLKEFGQKKMIARVLIIAVLINFSLLFTKMVIDASNFTGSQIYTAAALGTTNSTTQNSTIASAGQTAAAASVASAGIAGQFINLLGVGTFGNTYTALDSIAQAKDSGWIALLHGIFVFVILIATALVLFYGSFLLVSRMVMLIFLMITASIAFASYLVPKWETSHYGWDAWWGALLWCAALAPVLMLLLWMTLNISYAIHGPAGSGSFGDMIAHPATGPNISTLVNYLIILGLLFASFKISSKVASKIGGFSIASMVPGIGLGVAGALTGLVGRNTLGWGASAANAALSRRAYGYTGEDGKWVPGKGTGAASRFAMQRLNNLKSASYNPLAQKQMSKLGGTLGVPKLLLGKDAAGGKGFDATMKAKAAAADEAARGIEASKSQKEGRERAAEAEGRLRFREQKKQTQELINDQKKTGDAIRQQAEQAQPERSGANAEVENADKAQKAAAADHESKLRIAEQRAANAQNPASRQSAESEAAHLRATRQQEMSGEAERIRLAREKIAQLDAAVKTQVESHPQMVEFSRAIKEAEDNLHSLGKDEGHAGGQAKSEEKKAISDDEVALRKALLWDKRAEPKIKGVMDEHHVVENWKHFRATEPGAGHGDAGHAAPAAAPHAEDHAADHADDHSDGGHH